jgi:hypothetical protein
MADDVGMFDGSLNEALFPDSSFGTFSSQNQADDFARPFSVYDDMRVLFITGDETIWGEASYSALFAILNSPATVFSATLLAPNLAFETNSGPTVGNVLMRDPNVLCCPEDPWISLSGDHSSAVAAHLIIWGENNFNAPGYVDLKNAHGGVNVFVSTPSTVPIPAALPLFAGGLGLMGWMARRRRKNELFA